MINVALDALGGDYGTEPLIKGLVLALKKDKNFHAHVVGKQEEINQFLPKKYINRVTIHECNDYIKMNESATEVLKRKESSAYIAIKLVKDGICDCYVSAGHSGASMSLATLIIGRLKGVLRPPLATTMPTVNGVSLLLDVGANTDCDPKHLHQFAIMGYCYSKYVLEVSNPKVGLLSNGEEENKGNELTKKTFPLCKEVPGFTGNVEGSDIFNGSTDVLVCDGFTGNLILKTSEGIGSSMMKILKNNIKSSIVSIAGSVLMLKAFKGLKRKVDYAEYGGAPLLGVKAPVIIAHGKSNPMAIKNAIFQGIKSTKSDINEKISQIINEEKTSKVKVKV